MFTLEKVTSIPTNKSLWSVSEPLHQLKGNVKFYYQRHTPDTKFCSDSHHFYYGVFVAQQGRILAKSIHIMALSVPALLIPTISTADQEQKDVSSGMLQEATENVPCSQQRSIHVVGSSYRFEDIRSNKRKLPQSLSASL